MRAYAIKLSIIKHIYTLNFHFSTYTLFGFFEGSFAPPPDCEAIEEEEALFKEEEVDVCGTCDMRRSRRPESAASLP